MIVTDQVGHITFMNKVAEEVTRWKFHEAKGRPGSEIFHIVNERLANQLKVRLRKS